MMTMIMIQLISVILLMRLPWGRGDSEHCYEDTMCSEVRGCSPIYQLLENVKQEPDNSLFRRNIVHHVRDRICGDRQEKKVCCPLLKQDLKIGSFTTLYHDVSGDLFVLDSHSLIIKNFTYDGTAPDAFFMAGVTGESPHGAPDAVLSFPFTGEHYDYQDDRLVKLEMFEGEQDVVLTLPPDLPVTSLQWVSVWCRQYAIDFGHIIFT